MTAEFYANDGAFRKCSKCGELRPTDDGRRWNRGWCPDCRKAYNAAHYAANRDKALARAKAAREANPDKVRAYQADYRAAHRTQNRAYSAAYYAVHRDKWRGYNVAYNATDAGKDAMRRAGRNYRARKAAAICVHGAGCFDDAARMMPARCATPGCRRRRPDADHIIPLAQGGLDCRHNLQPLCHSCNSRKRDRLVDAQATGYLL